MGGSAVVVMSCKACIPHSNPKLSAALHKKSMQPASCTHAGIAQAVVPFPVQKDLLAYGCSCEIGLFRNTCKGTTPLHIPGCVHWHTSRRQFVQGFQSVGSQLALESWSTEHRQARGQTQRRASADDGFMLWRGQPVERVLRRLLPGLPDHVLVLALLQPRLLQPQLGHHRLRVRCKRRPSRACSLQC